MRSTVQVVETFWIPVSALVPILAIAYVIEARGIASGWTFERRWAASAQGLSLFVGGALLLTVEARTLIVLITAQFEAWEVVAVLVALVVIFAVVAFVPLSQIFSAAMSAPMAEFAWIGVAKPLSWFMNRKLQRQRAEFDRLESRILEVVLNIDRDIEEAEAVCSVYAARAAAGADVRDQLAESETLLTSLYLQRVAAKESMAEVDSIHPRLHTSEERLKRLTDKERFNRIVQDDIARMVGEIRARM
jgi:hypothetical protein